MKFLKTIELWGNEEMILRGELVLQRGQWVTCGGGVKSRFMGTNGRSIDVVHGSDTREVMQKFTRRVSVARERLQFF